MWCDSRLPPVTQLALVTFQECVVPISFFHFRMVLNTYFMQNATSLNNAYIRIYILYSNVHSYSMYSAYGTIAYIHTYVRSSCTVTYICMYMLYKRILILLW